MTVSTRVAPMPPHILNSLSSPEKNPTLKVQNNSVEQSVSFCQ